MPQMKFIATLICVTAIVTPSFAKIIQPNVLADQVTLISGNVVHRKGNASDPEAENLRAARLFFNLSAHKRVGEIRTTNQWLPNEGGRINYWWSPQEMENLLWVQPYVQVGWSGMKTEKHTESAPIQKTTQDMGSFPNGKSVPGKLNKEVQGELSQNLSVWAEVDATQQISGRGYSDRSGMVGINYQF